MSFHLSLLAAKMSYIGKVSFLTIFVLLFHKSSSFDCSSNDDVLQVHLVPHTHDDVGWLKTVDEYFYGANRPYKMQLYNTFSIQSLLNFKKIRTELSFMLKLLSLNVGGTSKLTKSKMLSRDWLLRNNWNL